MIKFKKMSEFFDGSFDLLTGIDEIRGMASSCGYLKNPGGMDLVSGAYLYLILKKIQPKLFVESGIWRGFSSMIFHAVNDYQAAHYLFDPGVRDKNFMRELKFRVEEGHYHDVDVGSSFFSSLGDGGTFFFDDHQDHLERLFVAYSRGAKYVIFDDNYMFGGGGHKSLFDHFRQVDNPIFDSIVKSAWVAQPLFIKNKGIEPLYDDSTLLDTDLLECDENYQWLTLLEINQISSISKSQGSIKL